MSRHPHADSLEGAIDATIRACGGYKATGGRLWPSMNLQSAYARLKHCAHEDQREKLSAAEMATLTQWGAERLCTAIPDYICARAYGVFTSTITQEERTEMHRRVVRALKDLDVIASVFGKRD